VNRKEKKKIYANWAVNDVSVALWAKARSLEEMGNIELAKITHIRSVYFSLMAGHGTLKAGFGFLQRIALKEDESLLSNLVASISKNYESSISCSAIQSSLYRY